MGGHLASVHTWEENQFIYDEVAWGYNPYIGLHRDNNSADWVWTDGSNADTLFWQNGGPMHFRFFDLLAWYQYP